MCHSVETPDQLVSCILFALGVSEVAQEHPLKILRQHLSSHDDNPILIEFDNLESLYFRMEYRAQVDDIFQQISAFTHVQIIVTLRGDHAPGDLRWTSMTLQPLPMEAARELFLELAPNHRDQFDDLECLLTSLNCMPLAIKLMAQLGTCYDCRTLLGRWEQEHTAMLSQSGGTHISNVDVSIAISLQAEPMQKNSEALRLLGLLCCLPDGLLDWKDRLELITTSFTSVFHAFETLKSVALIQSGHQRITILSPIRSYVQERHNVLDEDIRRLEGFYIGLVEKHSGWQWGDTYLAAYQELSPEVGNMQHLFRHALSSHPDKNLAVATLRLSKFLTTFRPSVELLQDLLPHLDQLGMTEMKGGCLDAMGEIHYYRDDHPAARQFTQDALLLYKHAQNDTGLATCLQRLGDILRLEGKYEEARERLEEAHTHFSKIGVQRGMARCLRSLGEILWMEDKYVEAREKLEEVHSQFSKIGNQCGMAQCLQSLGDILRMEGKYVEAREQLEEAHSQFSKIGNLLGMAQCLQCLGEILRMEGKYVEAREKLDEAHSQSSKIGNQCGMAQCLQSLGDILRMEGKYVEAREQLEEAHSQFSKIGNLLGMAQCLQCLGVILFMEHKYEEAREKLEEAHSQFSKIGDQLGMADCLWCLGEILRKEGRYQEAREMLERAHSGFSRIGPQYGTAWCLTSLGYTLDMENKPEEARQKLEEALVIFSQIGHAGGMASSLSNLG